MVVDGSSVLILIVPVSASGGRGCDVPDVLFTYRNDDLLVS